MRAFLILALLAAPAVAEPVVFYAYNSDIGANTTSPAELTFEFTRGNLTLESGVIPNIVPNNGMTWTIDETNAADYGLDWLNVEAEMAGISPPWFGVGLNGNNSSAPTLNDAPMRFASFDLEQLEIDMRYWHLPNPPFNNHASLFIEWTIYGDGLIVPEPSALVMVFLGLPLLFLGRRRLE